MTIESFRRWLVNPLLGAAVLGLSVAGATAQESRQPPAAPAAGATNGAATEAAPKPALPESWIKAFQWRSIGPANMGGRITAISVYEKDPSLWFAATASGGLLKTINNGITFEHQFDTEATVSIGDVMVAPSDPNIVWVGTGESNPRNSSSWGDGVYKSEDGGKTWKNMGLRQSFQIGKVLIHPTDPKTVFVGAMGRLWGTSEERGLYKTTDGGETWQRVLYVDDKTGVTDIQMKPGDPGTMLAFTYERQRDGFDTNEPAKRNGPGSGLWRSTDGGNNWTRINQGLPEGNLGRGGLHYYRKDPNTVFLLVESDKTGQEPPNAPYIGLRGADAEMGARITDVTAKGPAEEAGLKADDIVVSIDGTVVHSYNDFITEVRRHVAGDTLKLVVSRERKSVEAEVKLAKRPEPATRQRSRDGTGRRTDDTGGAGTFSSGLGGQRANLTDQQGPDGHNYGGLYKSTDGGESWTRINSINPRPMYFSQVRCDPNDDQLLWVLGVSLARSKDGGKTFTDDGGRGTHADHHAMWVNPADGRHIILGNDGGLYVTYDRGENWDHLNHVALGQFYHVAVDPRPNYMVYGGLQDNGSWGGPSRSRSGRGPINEDWFRIGGGDGFVCRVDPNDPDQVYYESQGGAMGRFNLRTGERASIRPPTARGERQRWNWKTPFLLSNHNSKIFYAASQYVYRSYDQGRTMKRISDEFTRTRRGSGTAMAESPLDPDVLWAGSDDGALIVTRDGGISWTKLTDFPLTDEERNAVARAEESESGAGTTAPTAPGTPPAGEAAETPAAPATPPAGAEGQPPAETEAQPSERPTGERPAAPPEEGPRPERRRGGGAPGAQPSGAPGAGGMVDRLRELDANKDGKIERSEVPEQMERMFERFDANSDGAIDDAELRALAQRAGQGGGRGQRGGGGGRSEQASDPSRPRGGILLPGPARAQAAPPRPSPAAPEADDGLTGTWAARAVGENLPAQAGEFTLLITLGDEGRVTGEYEAERGNGALSGGKFDPKTGDLTATIETDRAPIEIKAKLADGKLRGEADIGGGRFQFGFEADRTSRVATREPQDDPAAGRGRLLLDLLPGARWVSSIETSRFRPGRCYVTFDGHRSNDDEPYAFVTEDYGMSWRPIRGNLPTSAGSTKVIREDLQRENLLYLGTEFGAYVSIDRGKTWTRFNNNLPTVAVHEFALHPTSGEIVAATHGRSLWVLDVTPLRQMSENVASQPVALFSPRSAVYWRPDPARGGGNRRFVGENGDSSAAVVYALGERARTVELQITDLAGEVIRELEAPAEPGLHRVTWDLRRTPQGGPRGAGAPGAGGGPGARGAGGGAFAGGGGGAGGGARGGAAFGAGGRGGRMVPAGTYRVALKVDGEVIARTFRVLGDPDYPDYQPWERASGFGGEDDEDQVEPEHDDTAPEPDDDD